MFTFLRVALRALALVVCLLVSAPAWTESTILSGMFDGAEPAIDQLSSYDCARGPLGYRKSTFQVSNTGFYKVYDAFDHIHRHGALAVYHQVYEHSFNPLAPGHNLKKWTLSDSYKLTTGVTYVLVVQHQCESAEGAWAIAIIGPGSVSSSSAVEAPAFTKGKFTSNDPTMISDISGGEKTRYKQYGPIQVSRDGAYYFSDTYVETQVSLQVYTAPVDPAHPAVNRVAWAAYGAPLIDLKAGHNYYFVTQWIQGTKDGEFFYVLAPPAPFRINPGLSGSWYNPATPGQGFFLTVYEKLNQVFLAWFTFASGSQANDESGQRWMTALGSFADKSAELDVEWTSGGQFNAAEPVPEQEKGGFIRLDFTDCNSGQVIYDLDSYSPDMSTISGVIPIQRLAGDAVALCESLYAGPGMPGPL
ncbi:MAG TPA: hypothetical protein VKN35_01275 [Xanthomonadales bacterium]|nr:hypothetical protein [Xanthomonadales bacterium]